MEIQENPETNPPNSELNEAVNFMTTRFKTKL